MKWIYFLLLISFSCAHKVIEDGGGAQFDDELWGYLSPEDHFLYAQSVVRRERRDPPEIKLTELTSHEKFKIKRVAIAIFETIIQPTRNGLSSDLNIYLSERGKQKLTEKFYKYWVKNFSSLNPGVEVVSSIDLKSSAIFHQYGVIQEDYILDDELSLNDLDAFYLSPGKKVTTTTTLNPPGMRDLSLVLIPATDLMIGPKFSSHQKHWVNDLSKEFNLDAIIIVQIQSEWRSQGIDKRTKEEIPEELKIKINSSLLTSFGNYQRVGRAIKPHENFSENNIALGTYSMNMKSKIKISAQTENQNFEFIQKNLLHSLEAKVENMSHLMMLRLSNDLAHIKE